jgi:diguanylate cyclase
MTTNNTLDQERTFPAEFTKRISSLFLVCIDGLCSQIPDDGRLNEELKKLGEVIKKSVGRNKKTDLGQEIEEYFKGISLEKNFHEAEKQATKELVLSIANALKEVLTDLGGYDQALDECIEDISETEDMKDISAIKDKIMKAAKKSKSKTQAFKKELEISNNAALTLSKKLEVSQSQAVIDALTKILNRSAYDMRIAQTIDSFNRNRIPVCLIVIDIDNFKIFNDTHGHRAGDKVLYATAATMKNSIRTADQIFRYGGEEFVVLLYDVPFKMGKKVAEKIRSEVKRDFLVYKGKELKVTISLGISFLQEGDTGESLFERADKALYEVKRNGRDKVGVSPVEVPV